MTEDLKQVIEQRDRLARALVYCESILRRESEDGPEAAGAAEDALLAVLCESGVYDRHRHCVVLRGSAGQGVFSYDLDWLFQDGHGEVAGRALMRDPRWRDKLLGPSVVEVPLADLFGEGCPSRNEQGTVSEVSDSGVLSNQPEKSGA